MDRCYVLDYNSDSIYCVKLPNDIIYNEEVEPYLRTLGFNIDSISYMITSNELEIINL